MTIAPQLADKSRAELVALRQTWKARRARRRARLARVARIRTSLQPPTRVTPKQKLAALRRWRGRVEQADRAIAAIDAALAWKRLPLRMRALSVARAHLGIREVGGNNRGPQVDEIIRDNGGTGPEPWCGDFVARCYRWAGSSAVQRGWAAVRNLGRLAGMRPLAGVRSALAGDLVCFRFPGGGDHVGILVGYCDAGGRPVAPAAASHVHTIDGNSSGDDVSDSAAGGDGVGEQIRSLSLVERMVRVTR